MPACEKCWSDAGGSTAEYYRLLDERKDNPCSPREQAGQFWDAIKRIDTRLPAGDSNG